MAFESSDALLVPTERSVWSDRGVGQRLFFLSGFALIFNAICWGLNGIIARNSLLRDRFRDRR